MTNRGSLPIALTFAALCVAGTAACASTSGGAPNPASVSVSASVFASASASASASEAPPVTSTSPVPASAPSTPVSSVSSTTPPCTAARLTVKADASGAAGGHSELVVKITNTATTTCAMYGYPAVVGSLQSGGTVRGVDDDNVSIGMAYPGSGLSLVILAPSAAAWVPLNFLDNPINGATSCPSFSSFAVTPPGVDQAFTIQAPSHPSDCDGIKVPPVLSATDAVIPSGN